MEIQTFKMRGNNESDFGCIWQAKKSFKRSCRNRRWSSPATESPIYLTWRHSQNKPHKIIPKVYCILYFISFIRSCHILQFENPVFKFTAYAQIYIIKSGLRRTTNEYPFRPWRPDLNHECHAISNYANKILAIFQRSSDHFPVYSLFVWVTFMTF